MTAQPASQPWRTGFFVIAGPCAIESRAHALETADAIAGISARTGVPIVYKSSFDKANRSSDTSFRGLGMSQGLAILAEVREASGLPVITDVHEADQAAPVAEAVDMLQTPAFLCRQTDFIAAVASTGRPVNIKKGQFLSPWEMGNVIAKARAAAARAGKGEPDFFPCERGTSFGYGNLVVDMRGLSIMRAACAAPVVFDATHSVQLPGAAGTSSGGERAHAPALARAAVATGAVSGVFMETHPDPDRAPCDGPNMIPLREIEALIAELRAIHELVAARAA